MESLDRTYRQLTSSEGQPLVHKLYRHEKDPAGLVLVFPGDNYGVDGPLLYYPAEILRSQGWDTFALTYGFQSSARPFQPEFIQGLIRESREAVIAILSDREYPRVGLIGKSLGAAVVAFLCQSEKSLSEARAVYLTPPIGVPLFDPIFRETDQPAYLAMGTADRFYDPDAVRNLRDKRSFEMMVIENADHSMDVPGDLAASVAAVRQVVEGALAFFLKK